MKGENKQLLCAAEGLHVRVELHLDLGVVVHRAQAVHHVLHVHLPLVVRVLVVEHLLAHSIELHPVVEHPPVAAAAKTRTGSRKRALCREVLDRDKLGVHALGPDERHEEVALGARERDDVAERDAQRRPKLPARALQRHTVKVHVVVALALLHAREPHVARVHHTLRAPVPALAPSHASSLFLSFDLLPSFTCARAQKHTNTQRHHKKKSDCEKNKKDRRTKAIDSHNNKRNNVTTNGSHTSKRSSKKGRLCERE